MATPSITFHLRGVPDAFRHRGRLRRWLKRVAREHGLEVHELAFVLMTDAELLEYNQRYLDHDTLTDVITFDGQTGTGVSGDVLMSYDRIRENAREYGTSAQRELHRVMVHGVLHLLGQRDKTEAQRRAMRDEEDRWLAVLDRLQ